MGRIPDEALLAVGLSAGEEVLGAWKAWHSWNAHVFRSNPDNPLDFFHMAFATGDYSSRQAPSMAPTSNDKSITMKVGNFDTGGYLILTNARLLYVKSGAFFGGYELISDVSSDLEHIELVECNRKGQLLAINRSIFRIKECPTSEVCATIRTAVKRQQGFRALPTREEQSFSLSPVKVRMVSCPICGVLNSLDEKTCGACGAELD
jgi:hypothetical protein